MPKKNHLFNEEIDCKQTLDVFQTLNFGAIVNRIVNRFGKTLDFAILAKAKCFSELYFRKVNPKKRLAFARTTKIECFFRDDLRLFIGGSLRNSMSGRRPSI